MPSHASGLYGRLWQCHGDHQSAKRDVHSHSMPPTSTASQRASMARDSDGGLTRTSSLVIHSPTKSSTPGKKPGEIVVERVISDSEEERARNTRSNKGQYKGEIIDLSSGSEGEFEASKSTAVVDSDPFFGLPRNGQTVRTEFSCEIVEETETEDESDGQPRYFPRSAKTRRAVLTDSEGETKLEETREGKDEPCGSLVDDGVISVLNNPPSRKSMSAEGEPPSKSKVKKPSVAVNEPLPEGRGQTAISEPTPSKVQKKSRPQDIPGIQATVPVFFVQKVRTKRTEAFKELEGDDKPSPSISSEAMPVNPTRARVTPKRKTKNELEQENRDHLAAYAQALFDELNESVFKNRLPKETQLKWNNRLLCTAGRAKWHRDAKGVVTTSIDLSTKVLDCEERIRNTLSHEMCHLACWMINQNIKENHGGVWRGWVEEVMEKRPDIRISKTHSYNISYKYNWQCQTTACGKIYGRFSNSIDPQNTICAVCKGELVPLFKTRARKTKVINNMATIKPRDSPLRTTLFPGAWPHTAPPTKPKGHNEIIIVSSDTESDHRKLSDVETQPGDDLTVSKSGEGSMVITRPKGSDEDRTRKDKDTSAMRKLVTHMSIIDLTDD